MAYRRLGDILTSNGVITEQQLNEALAIGREKKKRLGEVLIDLGVITERQLIDVLTLQLGVDYVDLTTINIPSTMTSMVPRTTAQKHRVVPVRVVGDSLYLAMEDPLNFMAIEEVKTSSKKRIIPLIATGAAVDRAIVTLYGNEGVNKAISELAITVGESAIAMAADEPENTAREADNAPTVRLVNSVIERAVAEHASDIHMEPRESGLVVRMRIDGMLHTILTIPRNLQNSVISRVKIIGEMDIAERRIPLDGRANVLIRGQDIDLRISTLPTIYGEKVVIRLLYKSGQLLTRAGIGLNEENMKKYLSLVHNANGVVLIVGPTGSGKSTTMYTMVSDLNEEHVNLVTLEDPVEYNIDGVNQVQINEKVGMTFANGLRSILRQDPDIIAVGEIRDGETAEIAMRAAITGHLVLSTIHTNDAISALDRLSDIGVEPYLTATALKGIISQRLVRRICSHCREEYIPTDEEMDAIDLPEDQREGVKFYRGKGCPDCLSTGYRGRIATFEILTLNHEIRTLFRDRASSKELMDAIYRSDFVPMMEDARRLVLEGTTTVSEAMRILSTTDD